MLIALSSRVGHRSTEASASGQSGVFALLPATSGDERWSGQQTSWNILYIGRITQIVNITNVIVLPR
jgi:hypothetical protein